MRLTCKLLLAAAIIALTVSSTPAQPQPFPFLGGFGGGGAMLLMNKSVQEELKMTKEQTEKLGEFREKMMEKMKAGFGDREKMQAMMKELAADSEKLAKDILKPEQSKRFKQIERQQAGILNFAADETQKALKLSDDQKDKIKTISEDVAKDAQTLMKDAGRDFKKMAENRTKIQAMNKEAMEKVNALLNADQKKAYRDLLGEPFELKTERPNFPGKPGEAPRKDF